MLFSEMVANLILYYVDMLNVMNTFNIDKWFNSSSLLIRHNWMLSLSSNLPVIFSNEKKNSDKHHYKFELDVFKLLVLSDFCTKPKRYSVLSPCKTKISRKTSHLTSWFKDIFSSFAFKNVKTNNINFSVIINEPFCLFFFCLFQDKGTNSSWLDSKRCHHFLTQSKMDPKSDLSS